MFVVSGSHHYGKIHQVPGLFHVATKFVHIQYFPVWPLKSFVRIEKKGTSLGQHAIPLSWKSTLFAWLRALLWCLGGMLMLFTILAAWEASVGRVRWVQVASAGLMALIAFGLVWFTYRVTRLGPRQAIQLADELGIPMDLIVEHFAAHPEIDRICDELQQEQTGAYGMRTHVCEKNVEDDS